MTKRSRKVEKAQILAVFSCHFSTQLEHWAYQWAAVLAQGLTNTLGTVQDDYNTRSHLKAQPRPLHDIYSAQYDHYTVKSNQQLNKHIGRRS